MNYFQMPELLNEPLPLFTTDVLKCRNFLLLNDNFNWPYGIYRVVGSEALSVLSEVVLEKGINHRIGPNLHLFHVRNDWLPTTGFSLPSQYQEGVLLSSDVATVVDEWTYAIMDAEDYVKYLIDNFPSVCIRDDKGILVGWFLQHTFGTLGILHVKDAHRHRGLAKYMVRKLSEKILENNQYAYVNIPETNDVSRKLHERCGFRITGATSKIIYILGRDSGKYNFPTDKQNIMK
ncbi:hypothetical protein LSH36_405g02025 [Paralvinella palmiformis]|uniref:N-acetyltransferase domain-containing protein n=1 Tax=Paralvinella palmiformis TaxID=53620 RepID=A0AAD9MYF7_9ANNE|nr:hypothetical protein LSH36_405g02025 [Paralvinella palmiformis]